MSIYLGDTPLANSAASRNMGEIIQSTIPLSDAGLHLLDGALINGAGSYAKFVTYIAGLVSNYPDLFTTEAAWQQSVTDYGVCGKFVYDSVNNTVRLPKITGFVEGTTDVTALGDLVEAGLPNITGSFGIRKSGASSNTIFDKRGALSGTATTTDISTPISTSGTTVESQPIGIDASRSSSIYGNSATVQPQSIKVIYYIVIANSVKTNIEVDIDQIATDLNGKADVDLSNVNTNGTSLASGWAMPSSRYINLTLGASGSTYTAPANGWFVLAKRSGATNGSYIMLENQTSSMPLDKWEYGTTDRMHRVYIPVKKGDVVRSDYSMTGETRRFRFIYAEGEENV